MGEFRNSAEMISSLVGTLSGLLREKYIFPEVAEEICQALVQHQSNGFYEYIDHGESLADTITQHLREASRDDHLWVRYHSHPLPEHHGNLLENEEKLAEIKAIARQRNYGIPRVERLDGNVGLIEVRYFYRLEWGSQETGAAAMNFLANMHALIVDLRRCQGGNPHMVAFLSSYLFEGTPIHLNSLYWRSEERTEEYWTLPDVPGPRIGGKPVYVLTSGETFSAGEGFTYNLQALNRVVVVGETTAGGAHPGSPFRLAPHFEAFIPMGRAINPITGANWEGVGVKPDISTPAESALDRAYVLALEGVIASLEDAVSHPDRVLLAEAQNAFNQLKDA
ncbi:MAG: S41 family peptidase [Anaerolineales bacterium]|nr:S41 family peptidase [Anaerolineales bacterium]